MIPQLISITLQSLGLPKVATECSVYLNKDTKHFVKTSAGISRDYYTHSEAFLKFGKGQGKISSTPNWMFISLTLLTALYFLCARINPTSACGKFGAKRVAEL
eukprot:4474895-Ditylum_brightwellii.AAC.1